MKSKTALDIISFLLILLFIYTAVSKLLDFTQFKGQMYNQTIPHSIATVLIWTLPEVEVITGLLLLSDKTKLFGFYLSLLLILLFTGYIILVLLNYFGRVPCSCGGVIKDLGWKLHLVFNLFFLLLSILAIFITNRDRRPIGK
jgi:putative oxidoreductase